MKHALVISRNIEAVHPNVNRFSLPHAEAVFIQRRTQIVMVRIKEKPWRVLVPQRIPNLTRLYGTSETRILVKLSPYTRSPRLPSAAAAHVIRRRRKSGQASVAISKGTGM